MTRQQPSRGAHTARPTRRRAVRSATVRRGAALLGAAAVFATMLSSTATDASWTATQSGAGTVVAATIPAPVGSGACLLSPGLLGLTPRVTVNWRIPAATPPYTAANIEYAYSTNGLLEPLLTTLLGYVTTTGPVGGVHTTVFGSGLLSGLLGSSGVAAVRIVDPASGWTSTWLTATASMELLGLNPTCVVGAA